MENKMDMETVKGLFMNIDTQLGEVNCHSDVVEGGIEILNDLVDEMNQYPEVAASFVKNGQVQKKLGAISFLLTKAIKNISVARTTADESVEKFFEEKKSADVRDLR